MHSLGMFCDIIVLVVQAIYERLEELDPTTFETDAIKLLTGLGFGEKMLSKATKVGLSPDGLMQIFTLNVFWISSSNIVRRCDGSSEINTTM